MVGGGGRWCYLEEVERSSAIGVDVRLSLREERGQSKRSVSMTCKVVLDSSRVVNCRLGDSECSCRFANS